MGDCKMGDSYSGNDDGSDDNQRDGGDMRDPSVSVTHIFYSNNLKKKKILQTLINRLIKMTNFSIAKRVSIHFN